FPEPSAFAVFDATTSSETYTLSLHDALPISLKANVDAALARPEAKAARKVLVIRHTGSAIDWHEGRDLWYHERMEQAAPHCEPEDRKSTRLNSSHVKTSYAVFCLKKKTKDNK